MQVIITLKYFLIKRLKTLQPFKIMAKKILITWAASHEAVLGLTMDEDIDPKEFEKDLNESDPADPNGALAKIEQMSREGNVDFQNMANVNLENFKVREI